MFNWFDANDWPCSVMRVNCCVVLLMSFIAYTLQPDARAETIILQNDTAVADAPGAVQTGFVEGDIAASIFELPPGVDAFKIKTVQALIMSDPKNGVATIFDVQLYCGMPSSTPPTSIIEGAAMVPDWMNHLDVSNEGWVVRSGSPFAIGLRYNWGIEGIDSFNGHVVADGDGCQIGKNLAYDATTDSWLDPCLLGAPGDFIIRVEGESIPSMAPFGDFNGDGFVDMSDFAALQRCLSLPEGTEVTAECLAAFDCDRSGRVDASDVLQFVTCARGPMVAADPDCGDCLPQGPCSGGAAWKWLGKSGGQVETFVWWWIPVVLVALGLLWGGWRVITGYLGASGLQADMRSWKSHAKLPNTQEQANIREAGIHLRDVWGATDPEARACGLMVVDPLWHCCFCFVVEGHNPKGFIAHNPVNPANKHEIYVDRQYTTTKYTPEGLALILWAEWWHMEYGTNEKLAQEKLKEFRSRHNADHVVPEMIHGTTDHGD